MNKKLLYSLVLITGIVLVFVSVYTFGKLKTLRNITVAVANQSSMALIYVADVNGYFRNEGLNVTFHEYTLGRDALRDVLEGSADLATVYDIPTIISEYEGQELGIITSLHESDRNHAIAAYASRGLTAPGSLKGKTIAYTKNISTDFFLHSYLFEEGINPDEVILVNDEPENNFNMLKAGTVDAAVLFNPYVYDFKRAAGKDGVTLLYSNIYTEMSLLVGTRDYVRKNGSILLRVLRALKKAETFIAENREEAIRIVDTRLTNYDEDSVRANWDIYSYSLRLSNTMVNNMEREAQFFHDSGVIKGEIRNLRGMFITDYLQEVKPEAVTLY